MYERMLNKDVKPTIDEICSTIGEEGTKHWRLLDEFFNSSYDIDSDIRFPFGNNYGWGVRYKHKSKTLCYMFPEKGAFTVFFQIGKSEVSKMIDKLDGFLPRTKVIWEKRYPCGDGGWLHYRVLCSEEIEDIKELMRIKKKPIKTLS